MKEEVMNYIFNDIEKNKVMLEGSYKKLKSYYYYNKNFLFMREKIAEFEYDLKAMDKNISELAKLLQKPNLKKSTDVIDDLINKIDFYVLPKSFDIVENKSWFIRSDKTSLIFPSFKKNHL
jgi:hypothetical protein